MAEQHAAVCLMHSNGGTGTLIASRWILTAAHVVDDPSRDFGVGNLVEFAGQDYCVKRIVLHPEWTLHESGLMGGRVDLALVELDKPVQRVQPIPIYVENQELAKIATIVGFGFTGTFDSFPYGVEARGQFAPTKRAGTNFIYQVLDEFFFTYVEAHEYATDLEAATAAGDSGGPALIEVNGQTYVAGVISTNSYAGDNYYGCNDQFARVSVSAGWIEDVTGCDFGVERPRKMWWFIGSTFLIFVAIVWLAQSRYRSAVSLGTALTDNARRGTPILFSPRLWPPSVKQLVGGGSVAALYPGVFVFLDFYSGLGAPRYLWQGPLPAAIAFCVTVAIGACLGVILSRIVSFFHSRARAD